MDAKLVFLIPLKAMMLWLILKRATGTVLPSGGDPTDDVPAWLQPVLRILAETQLELATKTGERRPRTAVSTVKLEEFRGGRETTTH